MVVIMLIGGGIPDPMPRPVVTLSLWSRLHGLPENPGFGQSPFWAFQISAKQAVLVARGDSEKLANRLG